MTMAVFGRVLLAFLYGVVLGICWEFASMTVLLGATVVEHFFGTAVMTVSFLGVAALAFAIAARAELRPPSDRSRKRFSVARRRRACRARVARPRST